MSRPSTLEELLKEDREHAQYIQDCVWDARSKLEGTHPTIEMLGEADRSATLARIEELLAEYDRLKATVARKCFPDTRAIEECRKRDEQLCVKIEYARHDMGPFGPSWYDAADKERIAAQLVEDEAELKRLRLTILLKCAGQA